MTCQGRVLLMWDYGETSCNKPINMGVQPEGFQRAIGKPFGRLHRGEIPCNKKDQQQGKRFSQCWSVAPIWRDNMQVVGRASWGRSCGSAKLLAGTLRCLRLLLSAFDILVARAAVGALPQTPQGTPPLDPARGNFPLDPARGNFPLDPFRAIELSSSPYSFRVWLLFFYPSPALIPPV